MPEEKVNAHEAHDTVLNELYARRDEIDAAISAILFLKGSSAAPSGSSRPESRNRAIANGTIPSDAFFGLNIGDAAKKYLEMSRAKRTVPQITKALEDGGMPAQKPNTVYAALRRREVVTGDIMRVGEEWGLKEWFSNVNVAKLNPAKKAKGKRSKKKKTTKKAASKASSTAATPTPAPELKVVKPQESTEKKAPSKKPISNVDAVHEILTAADTPLHAEVLVQKLKDDYGKETNVRSIASSLPDDSTKRFTNIGGNTWALEKWPESKKVKAAAATA